MKKVLKSKLFVPMLLVALVAFAGIAYAAWTAKAVSPAYGVTTANPSLTCTVYPEVSGDTLLTGKSWDLSNLAPGSSVGEALVITNNGTVDFKHVYVSAALSNDTKGLGGKLTTVANTFVLGGLSSSIPGWDFYTPVANIQRFDLGALAASKSINLKMFMFAPADLPQSFAGTSFGDLQFAFDAE